MKILQIKFLASVAALFLLALNVASAQAETSCGIVTAEAEVGPVSEVTFCSSVRSCHDKASLIMESEHQQVIDDAKNKLICPPGCKFAPEGFFFRSEGGKMSMSRGDPLFFNNQSSQSELNRFLEYCKSVLGESDPTLCQEIWDENLRIALPFSYHFKAALGIECLKTDSDEEKPEPISATIIEAISNLFRIF